MVGGNPQKSIGKQVGMGEHQSPPHGPTPTLLPYCLTALLPDCLTALTLRPLPLPGAEDREPRTDSPIPFKRVSVFKVIVMFMMVTICYAVAFPSPLSGSRFSKAKVRPGFRIKVRIVSIPFKRVSVFKEHLFLE